MTKTVRNRKYDVRDILSDNLRALMLYHATLTSQSEIARHCQIPQRTVGRVLHGDTSANVSTLAGIAEAFGLEVWQLLVPGLDPRKMPRLAFMNEEEADALQKLAQAIAEIPGVGALVKEKKIAARTS